MLEIQNFSHTNLLSFGFFIKTNQAEHFCALVSSAGEGGGKKRSCDNSHICWEDTRI